MIKPTNVFTGRSTIRMYNCDCKDLMKSGIVWDLAIVDPPYGIKQDGHRENNRSKLAKSKKYHKAIWDQSRPDGNYFKQLFKVSKNQIIWGANNYPEYLSSSPCWIVWDKDNSGNFADCELAYGSFDTAVRKYQFRWNGMLQGNMKKKEIRIHPTQKPVQLYKWLLSNYAKEGQVILDTHGGSMSLAIACWELGYDLDICEIDNHYYNQSVKRFTEHITQIPLF